VTRQVPYTVTHKVQRLVARQEPVCYTRMVARCVPRQIEYEVCRMVPVQVCCDSGCGTGGCATGACGLSTPSESTEHGTARPAEPEPESTIEQREKPPVPADVEQQNSAPTILPAPGNTSA
jgi:hypothetical protein